jgi:putative transposase
MARLPRIWLPDLPQHLIIRGNNRQAVFRSDGDRVFFHRCLVEVSRQHGVQVHAYVLMGNHIHLLATGREVRSISRMIQAAGRRYVSYFNYLYKRTGTLWEGRYRSSVVETDRYLLTCQQYIELNPVRAGMVSDPLDFPWSSHRCLVRGKADDVVTPHALYDGLAMADAERRHRYRTMFDRPIPAETMTMIRNSVQKGWALASEAYCVELGLRSGRRAAPLSRGGARRLMGSDSIEDNHRAAISFNGV